MTSASPLLSVRGLRTSFAGPQGQVTVLDGVDLDVARGEILPNILSPVLVVATIRVAHVIIMEASLSFLGLGVQPPAASWGSMVADGREFLADGWWVSTAPGLAILIVVLAINLAGQGLREAFDPRLA